MFRGSRRSWCASQRKIHALDTVRVARSYSPVGPECIILNGWTLYIKYILMKKKTFRQWISLLCSIVLMAPNVFLLSCLFNDIKGPPPLMTVPITPLPSAHFFVFSHLITLQFIYKYIVTLISFLYLEHARYIPSSGTSHHGSYFSEHSFFHSFSIYHQSSPLLFCRSLFKS